MSKASERKKRERAKALARGTMAGREATVLIHERHADGLPFGSVTMRAVVENPLAMPGEVGEVERISVLMQIRDDPLGRLSAGERVSDAQYQAGRKWQAIYDLSTLGEHVAALDLEKPPGQVGATMGINAEMLDMRIRAGRELGRLSRVLGLEGESLVRDILGYRLFLNACARKRGMDARPKSKDLVYLGKRFRECLQSLAEHLGFDKRDNALDMVPPKRVKISIGGNANLADSPAM
jgi:hypothetical protein